MRIVRRNGWVGVLWYLFVGLHTGGAHVVSVTGQIEILSAATSGKPGDVANAAVWLAPLPEPGAAAEQPIRITHSPVRMVQKHKSFDPHVLVTQVGSAIEFPNLDPFFHNVFSLFEGKRFDLGLYEAGASRTVRFDRPGICYLFCNIHSEMSAVIVVVDTPYFAISDRLGRITIPEVPAGRYLLRVWYERALPEDLATDGLVAARTGGGAVAVGEIFRRRAGDPLGAVRGSRP